MCPVIWAVVNPADSNPLCLECGLCCNGVIFADVQLQPEDDAACLKSLGVPLTGRKAKFPQPCSLLDGCSCRGYSQRPKHCRDFECLLLKRVKAGRTDRKTAQEMIRTARRRAAKVQTLLGELGDTHEQIALSLRFRRVKRQLEKNLPDDETAETFGRLTLAVHDLNVLIGEAFYPQSEG